MPGYSFATLTQAQTDLALRLEDPTSQFWQTNELTAYIQEALRTWNALTSFWRGDFNFPSQSASEWYNIPQLTGSLRPYTLTDNSIYSMVEYHLLEPQTVIYPLAWSGSQQFSMADLVGATERRLNEVLGVTGCTISNITSSAVPGRTFLPDSVIDIRRIGFTTSGNILIGYGLGGYGAGGYGGVTPGWFGTLPLWEEDSWGEQSYDFSEYATGPAGTPKTWLRSTQPQLSFDVVPPLGVPGTYDLLVINGTTPLSTNSSTPLGIPDDWAWVVKWGVLADLLSRESLVKDVPRAAYANSRYRQGLQLMQEAAALLSIRSNGIPLPIDSIRAIDEYNPLWQVQMLGAPQQCILAGQNLITFAPITDSAPYSFTATVVQNAPVPVNPLDTIQVSRDVYDVIIDYSQHLAAFKQGGEEFNATTELLNRFMHEASLYNSRLSEMAEYKSTMYAQSAREIEMNPRYTVGTNVGSEE